MRSVAADVVVVGGGPAGLMAALAASKQGAQVMIVESDEVLGGGVAADDGALWLPGVEVGERGPTMAAQNYLTSLYGTQDPRREGFVASAAVVHQFLEENGIALSLIKGEPDSHPEEAGGRRSGRVFEPRPVNARRLGDKTVTIRLSATGTTLAERRRLLGATRSPRGIGTAVRVYGGRSFSRLMGAKPAAAGAALLVGLAAAVFESTVTVWRGSTVVGIAPGADGVQITLERDGTTVQIAARSVVVAAGGFSRDRVLRQRYLPQAADMTWSQAAPDANGASLRLAADLGADVAGFGEAEWHPSLVLADGRVVSIDQARAMPYSLIVDASGTRFANEAAPAVELGRMMTDRDQTVSAVPSFLIMDSRHRNRYSLGPWPPGLLPQSALRSNDIAQADSLNDLAGELGIDKAGLIGTVARFNRFARLGVDEDFRRGTSARDRAHGQPWHRPNRSLGSVERPPFFGVRIYPAENATRGGMVTDADGRVLTSSEAPIPGVFAAGSATASLWGARDPGPGAGLAAALVGGYRAGVAAAATGTVPNGEI